MNQLPVPGVQEEVAGLIETLLATEQRLEQLTGGEVDCVAGRDGRAFLLQRAQEQVRLSEAQKQAAVLAEMRALIDLMPGMIWFKDTTNGIIRVNQQVADAAGRTVAEIEGRPSKEIYPEDADRFHADDLEVIRSGIPKLGYVESVRGPDGQDMWVQTDKVPYRDLAGNVAGIVVVARDITESRNAEAILRESEERFAGAFEHAPNGMVLVMPNGRRFKVNRALCEMIGYSEEEYLSHDYQDITHPDDSELTAENVRRALAGEDRPAFIEKRFIHKDGHIITVELSISVVRDVLGKPQYMVGQVLDISARKQAQLDLQASQQRLRDLIDGLGPAVFVGLLTTEGILIEVNEAPLAAAGLKPSDVLGKHFADTHWWVGNPEGQKLAHEAIERGLRGESSRFDVRVRGACDQFIDAEFSLQPLRDESGKVLFLIPSGIVISDRKAMETALRESEAELRIMSEAMPQIVWITRPDGCCIYINQQFADYTGIATDESLGMEWIKPFHPDERARTMAAWQEAIMSTGVFTAECRLRRVDGVYRWWLIRGVPQLDTDGVITKWFGTCTDIHDLKMAEESSRLLGSAVQQAKESIIVTEADLDLPGPKIVFVNPAFTQMTGYSAEEAIGKTPRFLQGPATDKAVLKRLREDLEQGKVFEGEAIQYRKDGTEYFQEWQITPLRDAQDKITHFVSIQRDITERKETAAALHRAFDETERQVAERTAELAKANTDLLVAVEHADAANRAKSEFLSRMSHELRTPMNSVLGYAQLLDLRYDDPKIKEAAGYILRGGKHLLEMINEVLELARIESGVLTLSNESVEFSEILRQTIGLVQPMADSAGIVLTVEEHLCDGLCVLADKQRLAQVLINLLSNAIKYNRPRGSVIVRCSFAEEGFTRIEVSDNGPGIAESDQPLVFQPFQRFGDQGIEGSGLGLSVSQRFMSLMGGKLCLLKSTSEGSTFCIDLRTGDPISKPLALGYEQSAVGSLTGVRGSVLYIEDNASNMGLLEAILAGWEDITLIPAIHGQLGLELAQKHHPDLILLDIHLPKMMGDQVLKLLKENPSTAGIPVVVLSADATQSQIDKLMQAGALDYLTKPLDLARLFEVLKQYLPRG